MGPFTVTTDDGLDLRKVSPVASILDQHRRIV